MQSGTQRFARHAAPALLLLVGVFSTRAEPPAPPPQIDVLVQFIECDGPADTDTLFTRNPLEKESAAQIVNNLLKKRNGRILTAPRAMTGSGETSTVDMAVELRYPSDYTIMKGSNDVANVTSNDIAYGAIPTIFETRKVGTVMKVTPTLVAPGNTQISLDLDVAYVTEPTWRDYSTTVITRGGDAVRIPIEQPFFLSSSIKTTILIAAEQTVAMGGMMTQDKRQLFILVTARLVSTDAPAAPP